jgi:hypothetical protein
MATVVFPEISNNGFTQLDGAITDSATTINVDSTAAIGLSDSTIDAYVTIVDPTTFGKDPTVDPETFEIVQITAISTNQWTVTRGVDGTSGIAFSDNAYVFQRVNAAVIQRLMDSLTDGTDDLNINALTAAGSINADADGDTDHVLGRAKIGSASADQMHLAHFDNFTTTNFAVRQNASGATKIGAKSGQNVILAIANGTQFVVTSTLCDCNVDFEVALETNMRGAFGGTAQTATGTGATTIDWSLGNFMHFVFATDTDETFTFSAPTSPGLFVLRMTQGANGTDVPTWPATVFWANSVEPTWSTGANDIDIVQFYYDGTNYHGTAMVINSVV